MAGFQIPGLGQAKPNETLPPLPTDVLVAAAASADAPQADTPAEPEQPPAPAPLQSKQETSLSSHEQNISDENQTSPQNEAAADDPMIIDQPGSPPSLTHALEAALGGLEDATMTEEQVQTEQPSQVQAEPQSTAPGDQQEPSVELRNDQGEHPEWEIDSSPYESSSESSSSDSSDDSDNEGYELLGVEETARLLMEAEAGSDDEGEKGGKSATAAQLRTKNELAEEPIPRPEITVTPEMKIEELGAIEHIVEGIALVKAITPGEYQVLDNGSVLCTAERVVIGAVAETIGKVLQPMYTVRFNSDDEIKQLGLEVGTKVFYPVDHASYVFTEPLKNFKGSDASNIHDEEVGDEEMEFSDDEKEAEYKRSLKRNKKQNRAGASADGAKGAKGPHPLRQEMTPDGGLNYDDDGPYKPLARPPGFGSGPASGEPVEPPPRSHFQRGGRRGDRRGRGGRGRDTGRGGGRSGYAPPTDGYSLPPQGYQQPAAQQPANNPWPPASVPAPSQAGVPSAPSFGFQLPAGWPQPPPQQLPAGASLPPPPPPPPGWPSQGQAPAANGAFVNPAFLAALMSQMQGQNGQQPWGGQPQQ